MSDTEHGWTQPLQLYIRYYKQEPHKTDEAYKFHIQLDIIY